MFYIHHNFWIISFVSKSIDNSQSYPNANIRIGLNHIVHTQINKFQTVDITRICKQIISIFKIDTFKNLLPFVSRSIWSVFIFTLWYIKRCNLAFKYDLMMGLVFTTVPETHFFIQMTTQYALWIECYCIVTTRPGKQSFYALYQNNFRTVEQKKTWHGIEGLHAFWLRSQILSVRS